eukprot:2277358-Pyramimonas_sp.AAC.1
MTPDDKVDLRSDSGYSTFTREENDEAKGYVFEDATCCVAQPRVAGRRLFIASRTCVSLIASERDPVTLPKHSLRRTAWMNAILLQWH